MKKCVYWGSYKVNTDHEGTQKAEEQQRNIYHREQTHEAHKAHYFHHQYQYNLQAFNSPYIAVPILALMLWRVGIIIYKHYNRETLTVYKCNVCEKTFTHSKKLHLSEKREINLNLLILLCSFWRLRTNTL